MYKKTLCFLSGLCLCQSISRSSVSCYQNSIEQNVQTPFRKPFVLRDPVFPFWIMSLSKYFEIECLVLSKIDWRNCLNTFQKTTCTKRPCVSFLGCVSVKVFRDRVYRAIKVRLKKKSKRLPKTICTKKPYVSFLDYVFVKVFRDRVFHAIKIRLNKMSKRLLENHLY